MIFARLINGWGTGILNAIVPVWATETAEHKSRGQFVAIEFTLNIFGVVVAYWLEYGCSFYTKGNGSFVWRFPIAFQIIPLLFLFGIVFIFPESPRWLVKVGREEEARYILGRLRGETGEDMGKAEAEFQDIRNIAELERKTATRTSYWSMFTGIGSGKLHTGRRVQLVIWLQIMQEWIGIAGVTIYAPTIFRTAGIGNTDVQWISGLNTITYMVGGSLLARRERTLLIQLLSFQHSSVSSRSIASVAAGRCTGARLFRVSPWHWLVVLPPLANPTLSDLPRPRHTAPALLL